jgi:hypothetical protein
MPRDGIVKFAFKGQVLWLANPDPPSLELPGSCSRRGFSSKFYFLKKGEKI